MTSVLTASGTAFSPSSPQVGGIAQGIPVEIVENSHAQHFFPSMVPSSCGSDCGTC